MLTKYDKIYAINVKRDRTLGDKGFIYRYHMQVVCISTTLYQFSMNILALKNQNGDQAQYKLICVT